MRTIAKTEFSAEANLIELDFVPTIEEQDQLFIDSSIVLEF